jgi:hypothetical protein
MSRARLLGGELETNLSPPLSIVPTPAQRRVLATLARGDCLVIDDTGKVRLGSGGRVASRTVEVLLDHVWITEPLPPLPLLNEPARAGTITACGHAALNRGGPHNGPFW